MTLLKLLSSSSRQARQIGSIGRQFPQFRLYGSSSDEEGQGSKKMKEDPKARAEYRSWVENMLTELQTKAEGRGGSQEPVDSQPSDQLPGQSSEAPSTVAQEASQLGVQPAEQPATGSSEGNLGLSQEAAPPAATVQVTPEPASMSTAEPSGEASGLQDGNLGLPHQTSAQQDGASTSEPAPPAGVGVPKRTTVREEGGVMPDSVRGYRELGISESGDGGLLDQGEGHINSVRKFWPGDMYDPEDLVATTAKSYDTKPWMRAQVRVKKATNADVLREADFRNVSFLHKFTSETGQLPPRKVTRLQKKFHNHVMRQIKVARNMALLPPEGKLEELMPQAQRSRRAPSAARA